MKYAAYMHYRTTQVMAISFRIKYKQSVIISNVTQKYELSVQNCFSTQHFQRLVFVIAYIPYSKIQRLTSIPAIPKLCVAAP